MIRRPNATKTTADEDTHPHRTLFEDPELPWAIDMDGTLIREDVTELALKKSMKNPFYWPIFFWALFLKYVLGLDYRAFRCLERYVLLTKEDAVSFCGGLVELIYQHRARGGIAVLATASHYIGAQPIANMAGEKGRIFEKHDQTNKVTKLFDDVIGSNPPKVWNAEGPVKADLLSTRFPRGFLYAGNSKADLEVWRHEGCRAMLLVNCPADVIQEAKKINKPSGSIDWIDREDKPAQWNVQIPGRD